MHPWTPFVFAITVAKIAITSSGSSSPLLVERTSGSDEVTLTKDGTSIVLDAEEQALLLPHLLKALDIESGAILPDGATVDAIAKARSGWGRLEFKADGSRDAWWTSFEERNFIDDEDTVPSPTGSSTFVIGALAPERRDEAKITLNLTEIAGLAFQLSTSLDPDPSTDPGTDPGSDPDPGPDPDPDFDSGLSIFG